MWVRAYVVDLEASIEEGSVHVFSSAKRKRQVLVHGGSILVSIFFFLVTLGNDANWGYAQAPDGDGADGVDCGGGGGGGDACEDVHSSKEEPWSDHGTVTLLWLIVSASSFLMVPTPNSDQNSAQCPSHMPIQH